MKITNKAFTKLELLIVLAVVFLLGILLVPNFLRSRMKASTIKCSSNLKQIALSFKMFAGDNDRNFPYLVTNSIVWQNETDAWKHFLALSNELGSASILTCPNDDSRPRVPYMPFDASTNSLAHLKNRAVSFFVGLGASERTPDMVLVGDRNVFASSEMISGPIKEVTGTNMLQWDRRLHTNWGNVALSDGSVHQTTRYPAWKDHTNRVRLLLPNN
ncbi:MAG TPA: type II secretion system protein [Verrucomicrobiae bacterium]